MDEMSSEEKRGTFAHAGLALLGTLGGMFFMSRILNEEMGVIAIGIGMFMLPTAHVLAVKATVILAIIVWLLKYVLLSPFFLTRWIVRKISGTEPETKVEDEKPSAAAAFFIVFPLVGICLATCFCAGLLAVFTHELFSVTHPLRYFSGLGVVYGLALWMLMRAGFMADVEINIG